MTADADATMFFDPDPEFSDLKDEMRRYFVDKEASKNGVRTIHKYGCRLMPEKAERIPVGRFVRAEDALRLSRRYYNRVETCATCCNAE